MARAACFQVIPYQLKGKVPREGNPLHSYETIQATAIIHTHNGHA